MTKEMIEQTAKAWSIPNTEVVRLVWWIDGHVPKHYRALTFAKLLRRKRQNSLGVL